jgi:hypothetical protein
MTNWKKSSPETCEKIALIFNMVVQCADTPAEAAEILSGVYVRLWINGKADNGDIDNMLEGLCLCIKTNVQMLESTKQ